MKAKYLSIMLPVSEAFNDECVNLVVFRTMACAGGPRQSSRAMQHSARGDGRHLEKTVFTGEKNDARAQGSVDPARQAGDE